MAASVAFRSAETGRYLFWVRWTDEEWERITSAAAIDGVSVEDFILQAIERRLDEYGLPETS